MGLASGKWGIALFGEKVWWTEKESLPSSAPHNATYHHGVLTCNHLDSHITITQYSLTMFTSTTQRTQIVYRAGESNRQPLYTITQSLSSRLSVYTICCVIFAVLTVHCSDAKRQKRRNKRRMPKICVCKIVLTC